MKKTIALALGLALSGTLLAAGLETRQESQARQLSRKEAVFELVLKWGPSASRMQQRSVRAWADSMIPLFATADVANLNRALKERSYSRMVNALTGSRSHNLAKLPAGLIPQSLGALTSDLVFSPLPSCVIVNTTKPGSGGALAAGSVRHLKASGSSFLLQGGEDSNCGIPTGVRSLLVSVTSVPPSTSGYFRLWPYGTTEPLAANISYTGGQTIQNEIIMAVSAGALADFSVRSTGNTHLVVNVLGYFAAPVATALDCTPVTQTFDLANGARDFRTVSCPAGYAVTGGGVTSGSNNDQVLNASGMNGNGWFTSITNNSGATRSYTAMAQCCRIPGR